MKPIEALLLVAIAVVFLSVGVNMGIITTTEKMKRESLQGFVAKATYATNSVGEVSIKSIEWKKP